MRSNMREIDLVKQKLKLVVVVVVVVVVEAAEFWRSYVAVI